MARSNEMTIRALSPWFGGKRTLAPEIVDLLGKHTQYFEPFCGSMAVLFAKEPSQKETVNDLHGDLINLARVVQDQESAAQLYDRLQTVLFADGLLNDAVDYLKSDLFAVPTWTGMVYQQHVNRAYWYFLASWMMRNGVAGTQRLEYQIAVRWTKSGGSPTVRFRNAVDSLPAWHVRLKNVVILNRNAFEILDRFEDVTGTAIYADPPYLSDSRIGYGRHGGGSKYLHEFDHGGGLFEDCHSKLAEILRGYRKARIVVSYYDCPRVRELYEGWTFHEHTRQKHLHAQNKRGSAHKDAPELLITNF